MNIQEIATTRLDAKTKAPMSSRARKSRSELQTTLAEPSVQSFSGDQMESGIHSDPVTGADESTRTAQPKFLATRRQKSRAKSAEQEANQITQPSAETPPATLSGDDHDELETQSAHVITGTESGCDHNPYVNQSAIVASALILQIVHNWRLRQRWHRAEKALILQAKALLRALNDGDKEKASEQFAIAYKPFAQKRRPADFDPVAVMTDAVGLDVGFAVAPMMQSIANIAGQREQLEKQLEAAAKQLPVHEWTAQIGGFGALTLASIVGEAGDIGSYKSVAALWKRMGMAVIGGQRQRKVADAALAIEHGYSPPRRAVAYLLGQWLIMAGDKNPYRGVYEERKAYELPRCEAIAADPDLKKKYSRSGKYAPKAHANNRAARYMVKRVLRDFYGAWRRIERGGHIASDNHGRHASPLV